MTTRHLALTVLSVAFVGGCGTKTRPPAAQSGAGGNASVPAADASPAKADGNPTAADTGPPELLDPGTAVDLRVPAARTEAVALLRTTIEQDRPTTADAFLAQWKPIHATTLGYDPLKAGHLDLVQASPLRLHDKESAVLGKQGFVISQRQSFPTFFYGYKDIYAADLPVFISADSILYAVHRSYDAILKDAEWGYLMQALDALLTGMHQSLATGVGNELGATARRDADLYLTVARRLLTDREGAAAPGPRVTVAPVAGAAAAEIDDLIARARAADGIGTVALFGDPKRNIDFSQFRPRGHYVGEAPLEAYFRAMIWLGRTDLRIIQEQRFMRRQFNLAALLGALLDSGRQQDWSRIDGVLRGFVGESDNMTVLDFNRLGAALGTSTLAQLAGKSDQQIAEAITAGDFGIQRIASQIILVPPAGLNAPLDRTFLLFGQRYVLDSEVFSNVVFDRVLPEGGQRRMLPNPLDAAFAAMGNTHAAPLLQSELGTYKNYPAALHSARRLADAHEPSFWSGSLYHAWLGTLRAMSPAADVATQSPVGTPAVARTQAWSRRVLNTQLASWAELRHDTLLYAKQSYTAFPVCEFPDAYVDPYPEMWKALAAYADRGTAIVAALPNGAVGSASAHFAELAAVARRLEDMARRQLIGTPFAAEQLAWINEVVNIKEVPNCGPPLQVPDGWYTKLFYERDAVTKHDPTIADVHTNPRDAQVLHVATGNARLMVMTAETCMGPRAYAGLVSSYYEKLTTGFQRVNDQEWAAELKTFPADVTWMQDLVVR